MSAKTPAESPSAAPPAPDVPSPLDEAGGDDKAARGEVVAPPAWQAPDYTGPLTGEQALWRMERMRTK